MTSPRGTGCPWQGLGMAEGTWRGRGPDLPFLHLGAVCVWGEPARVVLGQKACGGGGSLLPQHFPFCTRENELRELVSCLRPLVGEAWQLWNSKPASVGSQVVSEAWWAFGGGPFGEKAHLDGGQEGGTKCVNKWLALWSTLVQTNKLLLLPCPPSPPSPLFLTLTLRRDWQGPVLSPGN